MKVEPKTGKATIIDFPLLYHFMFQFLHFFKESEAHNKIDNKRLSAISNVCKTRAKSFMIAPDLVIFLGKLCNFVKLG